MGLDIYLYTKAAQLHNEASDREEEEFYGKDWCLYDQKTDAEKQAFKENRQFDGYQHQVDVPSERYPNATTLNNRRYLRSSYNGAGFNSAVPRLLGHNVTYEWIFSEVIDIANHEYDKWWTEKDLPGLVTAQERAEGVAAELSSLTVPLGVTTVSSNPFTEPPTKSPEQAITWARDQIVKEQASPSPDAWFTSGWESNEGHYYGPDETLKVVAFVHGVDWAGRPATHVVYEQAPDVLETYIQSAVIAGEFAEEARKLIAEDGSCYVSWSG